MSYIKTFGMLQEHSNIRSEGMIVEESSMDKVEMLVEHSTIEIEEQDISNDDSNQQRVLIEFQEVINEDGTTMTQEILESEEVETENIPVHAETGIEVMEIDDSEQGMSVVMDTVIGKVETDMEVPQSTDSVPRIEITEANENEVESATEEDVKKIEPDTEAVSEDELPNEAAAKVRLGVLLGFARFSIN